MTRQTTYIHHLLGCRTTPLAHYLKAIAILRLVGEQADPAARGWWQDETFHLFTSLDQGSLERFFLDSYRPTPLLTPWNGGSGFYAKDNAIALEAIERSASPRFAEYRDTIAASRRLTGGVTEKPTPDGKPGLLAAARRSWRGSALAWLDAVVVLGQDGAPSYPPMLGTGGNDGRLNFTINFMQRVCGLFGLDSEKGNVPSSSAVSLGAALFGTPAGVLEAAPVGMFLPGSGGGPNSGAGYAGKAGANPWDYILMLEGAVCFAAALTQRSRTDAAASSPFGVPKGSSETAGYATAADEADSRGEQWLPLWSAPATAREVSSMLAEGRRQVGRSGAGSTIDMARATARLGVARGIAAFERYGYFERNGQAFVAVPLGRWIVREQPHQQLLDQIQPWLSRLSRAVQDRNVPASLSSADHACQEAFLSCCQNASDGRCWQRLLIAIGDAEHTLVRSRRFAVENRLCGLPRLDAQWLDAVDDGSLELELAVSFASLAYRSARDKWNRLATVRRYFVPLDQHDRFEPSADAPLANVGDLERCAIALVARALVDGGGRSRDGISAAGGLFPLIPSWAGAATLDAISLFLARRTDDANILALARPLMAIDWQGAKVPRHRRAVSNFVQRTQYGLVRAAYSPWEPPDGLEIGSPHLDPSIFHRLRAGDMGAVTLAARRLRSAGLRPLIDRCFGSAGDARRLAASLAFGIDAYTTRQLQSLVTARSPQSEPVEAFS